jgi:putative ABC transport system permease protein
LQDNYERFITEISSDHRILNCSTSDCLPHEIRSNTSADWFGRDKDNFFNIYYIRVDHRFLDLYDIALIEGNNFPADYPVSYTSFILNETAVQSIGWENAIGKNFGCNMIPKDRGRIVGVVKDFHYYPLHYKIQPLAIQLATPNSKNWLAQYLSIKISSHDISGTLSFIKGKWHQFSAHPFNYQFVDSQLDAMYKTEHKLGQLFSLFALIAILIGCLGLYGLVSFSIEQKIKEIGIRKVLGATLSQIMNLLLREIVLCIVIANCVAWPMAWYLMGKWLQDFAYRINMEWWIFLSSGILALLIALLSMGRLAIRAATANPVESLRYE